MAKGGTVLPSPSNIKGFVGGAANPVDLQVGPDGNLYYADIGGGTIRRIDYTAGANQPPVAVAKASPTTGSIGMTVGFDATASSDPNGDPLTYAWDLDADGATDDSTAPKPTWTYNAAGNYRVTLRATDGKGGTATDTVTIGVGQPTVTITAPTSSLTWAVGQTVDFEGSATDNQGVAITGGGLRWQLVLKHGLCPDCHDHVVQSYTGASGSFAAPDHDYPSELELRLTATDARGLSRTTSVTLKPKTTTLSFATTPAGLSLVFNGGAATRTPFTRTVIVGSSNSFSAPSPQTYKGKVTFQRWSDGVTTATHPAITAPATPVTYTATFVKR
jgi:PKD repeat protein